MGNKMQNKPKVESAEQDNESQRKYKDYQGFIESIQKYDARTKSEKWIAYEAKNIEIYGDQEALVYLRSRGHKCEEEIKKLIVNWKRAARQSIEQCSKGSRVENFETEKVEWRGGMPLEKASDVKNVSPYILDNFWGGRDEQELSIDATMLRTVEWCEIAGFDEWWERLAHNTLMDVVQGGIDPGPGSFWLFYLTRSNYAIELMNRALERTLEALELNLLSGESYPWRVQRVSELKGKEVYSIADHIPHASTIVFANHRLHPKNKNLGLIQEAVQTILKNQNEDGSWSCFSYDAIPSIEITAMCIHALVLEQPRGWEMATKRAVTWLLSNQDRSGCWMDEGSPDSVFLTVLVLDALDLVEDKRQVTFKKGAPKQNLNIAETKHRFKIAFSFPGEIRSLVEPVAYILEQELGRESVFYDSFHEAELARVNLDVYLQKIYHDESDIIAVFLCSDYDKKEWCGLEWRAIRDLIKKRRGEDVMFFRTDTSNIPGFYSIDGYIDAMGRSPNQLASLIISRLLKVKE
jgi:hypothetical protein